MLLTPQRVYNIVLDRGHVVTVDGVEAVTLGHGLQDDIVRHPYFGTHAVVDDLRALPGWHRGRIDLGDVETLLDMGSGLVAGMRTHGMSKPAGVAMPVQQ
mmetsp:Transcript_64913/g.131853  ORF Transcript_64913/g.131853 Transcript_64913/m.131853 type:complete len:100 (-) Transcript_64913:68-367(-)